MTFNDIWPFIVSPIVGLLIGGFPTAYIISKLVVGIDPREFGSGSVSTRNTIRAAGLWPWGSITFSADVIKGMFAVSLIEYLIIPLADNPELYGEYYVILAGIAAIAGHCWMPYLGFKGGKGLGTYVGLLFYFYWPTAFYWIIIMFILIRISGFSGIGAVWASAFITPFWYFVDYFASSSFRFGLPAAFWPHTYLENGLGWQFILLYALGSMLVLFFRHIPEFNRIRKGEAQAWKSLKTTEMLK